MNASVRDILLRVGEVAEVLGCAKSTVWRRSAAGTLPAPMKIGHSARWSELEILAAIEDAKAQRAHSKSQ